MQACAALTLTVFGYGVPLLTNPLWAADRTGCAQRAGHAALVLTVTNAINLIDGLDGLASGVVILASAALWTVARLHPTSTSCSSRRC